MRTTISFYSIIYFLCLSFVVEAQTKTVTLNIVTNQLNEGVSIPAEESFVINGLLPDNIRSVRVKVYKNKNRKAPAQEATWRKPFNFPVNQYDLAITEPLRGNETYRFEFYFYKPAQPQQLKMLQQALHNNLDAYIEANYQVERNGLVSFSARNVVKKNLETIVLNGTQNFEHFITTDFPGFSDIVSIKIEQLQNARLRNARFNVLASRKSKDSTRAAYAKQLINELKNLVKAETDQFLSDNMMVLADVREVFAETEKTFSSLPINIGYGGAYFGGGTNNIDLGAAPYAGVSIPLANKTFARFLGDASLSAGLFLTNMENNAGQEISGPFINRPLYAALGYKMFKVFRFNAGAIITTKENPGNGFIQPASESVQVYPFVGLSVELNLWLGFNRKK
ncbi:MAG: hypothetical protein ACXITV_06460 [Luteibaculaceae bacterium]